MTPPQEDQNVRASLRTLRLALTLVGLLVIATCLSTAANGVLHANDQVRYQKIVKCLLPTMTLFVDCNLSKGQSTTDKHQDSGIPFGQYGNTRDQTQPQCTERDRTRQNIQANTEAVGHSSRAKHDITAHSLHPHCDPCFQATDLFPVSHVGSMCHCDHVCKSEGLACNKSLGVRSAAIH